MNKYKLALALFVTFITSCSGGFGIPNEQVSVVSPGGGDTIGNNDSVQYPDSLELHVPSYDEAAVFEGGVGMGINFERTGISVVESETRTNVPPANILIPTDNNSGEQAADTIEHGQNQFVIVTSSGVPSSNLIPELAHFSYSVREDTVSGRSIFNLNTAFSSVRQMLRVDSVYLFFHANVNNNFASAVINSTERICHLFYFDADGRDLQKAVESVDESNIFTSTSLADINSKYRAVLSVKAENEVVKVAFFATGITGNIVDMAQNVVGDGVYTRFFVENISQELFNRINSTKGLSVSVLRNIFYSDVSEIDWRLFINTIDVFSVQYTYSNAREVEVIYENILKPFSLIEKQGSQILFYPTRHSYSVVFEVNNSLSIRDFNKSITVESNVDGTSAVHSVDWGRLSAIEENIGLYRFTDETALEVLLNVLVHRVIHQARQIANRDEAAELLNRYIREIDLIENNTQSSFQRYREMLNTQLMEVQN